MSTNFNYDIDISNNLKLPSLYDDNNNIYYLTLSYLFSEILKHSSDYIHTDNDGDYYIEVKGNTIYIYFEESDSWCDWMSNFDFIASIVDNFGTPVETYTNNSMASWKCHKGFFRVWKCMRYDIKTKVKKIIEERLSQYKSGIIDKRQLITNIICSGYSHGASLCGLCVEDMTYTFSQKYSINVYGYGFGCPRFTYGKLPEDVLQRFKHFYTFRIANDIVTHLPPRLFGYSHGYNKIITIKPKSRYGLIKAHEDSAYTKELGNLYLPEIHMEKEE